ncbi:MAG TPA: Ig domain-containing protein [Terriglobales bacterium]|nr:Ig domain-containing protein [Terriglobales bacterium]
MSRNRTVIRILYPLAPLLLLLPCRPLSAQENQAPPLAIDTQSLPKAFVRTPYQFHLQAHGGVLPLKWEITEGSLPAGIVLQADGQLSGTAEKTGEFKVKVTVTDSGRPAYQITHDFLLVAVSALMAQWGRYPKVNGQRLDGSILVSNETDHDFDLTGIVLAVNEIGRATAIGYQHFTLKKQTEGLEIPFGDNLPRGSYELNADVVAEVPETRSIFRTRLVPKERFAVQQGP